MQSLVYWCRCSLNRKSHDKHTWERPTIIGSTHISQSINWHGHCGNVGKKKKKRAETLLGNELLSPLDSLSHSLSTGLWASAHGSDQWAEPEMFRWDVIWTHAFLIGTEPQRWDRPWNRAGLSPGWKTPIEIVIIGAEPDKRLAVQFGERLIFKQSLLGKRKTPHSFEMNSIKMWKEARG